VEETGLPKPTVHRMLQQLEAAGMLQRESDGRHYSTGLRLRRLAEDLLLNNTVHGARHAVLRKLVEEVGESCNITALSGSEVLYLDRVETVAPLRFYLHPGIARAGPLLGQRQAVPGADERKPAPAPARTSCRWSNTRRTPLPTRCPAGSRDRGAVKGSEGYACDDEEFLPGLFCVAMLVPAPTAAARIPASRSRRR
jgi:IclR family acetate operon transcriptional repressor